MKKVATIILNRNLPEPTNTLCEHLKEFDGDCTDVFVLEAGTDREKLSKYTTWHVDDKAATVNGLRYNRGMNFALLELFKAGRWTEYDAFFLLTNDVELASKQSVAPLLANLEEHTHVGIISPCSKKWGELQLLQKEPLKYFWFIHNSALMLRRQFLEDIMTLGEPTIMNFIFDGENFRGYMSECELTAKAYANDWAAAISSDVFAEENETYLLEQSSLIKTEPFEENIRLYIEEGKIWLRNKYGYNSRWSMVQHAKSLYNQFFENHPQLAKYRV